MHGGDANGVLRGDRCEGRGAEDAVCAESLEVCLNPRATAAVRTFATMMAPYLKGRIERGVYGLAAV